MLLIRFQKAFLLNYWSRKLEWPCHYKLAACHLLLQQLPSECHLFHIFTREGDAKSCKTICETNSNYKPKSCPAKSVAMQVKDWKINEIESKLYISLNYQKSWKHKCIFLKYHWNLSVFEILLEVLHAK